MRWRRSVLIAAWLASAMSAFAQAEPVRLDVTVRLVDSEQRPLPDRPVRLAFASDPDWAAPDAGRRARTDAHGEAHFRAEVEIAQAEVDRDTTWFGLLTPAETARQLTVFVGLEYLGAEWRYGLTAYRFEDGTVMRRGFDVYLPDAEGRYTRRFAEDRGTHTIELPDGLRLSGSGHRPQELAFEPAADGGAAHWNVILVYRREPEPLRR